MTENNKKTILLVEDEALIAMAETQMLKKHGYEVVTAHTGEKAIETVDSNPDIALILMDIDLGKGIDGTEAAERILTNHDLPLAFLSSHTEPAVVEKTEGITSYGYIVKNSGETVLLASIRMAFRLYEAHAELKLHQNNLKTALITQEQTAEELRDSEEKFRTMMGQSIDMIFLHDLEGNIVDVNEAGVERTGYSREELLSMTVSDLDPDYAEREDGGNFWKNVGYDTPYSFEAHLRGKDSSVFPIEITVSKVILGGNTFIMTFSRDVSERKQAEYEMKAREENLRITLNSIGDAVISTDIDGNIVRMNPVAESLCGWIFDEAHGKSLNEVFHIVHADTRETVENPVTRVLETGNVIGLANHTMLVSTDGTEYQIADSAAPIRDDNGYTTGVVLVFHDVTEEYRKNRHIKESKELLDAVFMSIQDGISVLNSDLSVKYVNPVMERWYASNLPIIGKKCYSAYHNRTTPCVPCPSLRCLKTGKTEVNVLEVETELDSPVQWLELFSYPLIDENTGTATGVVEFVRDISERRRAETRLEESEARWHFALEGAGDGVWDWNAETDRVFFSRQWKHMLGYEEDEVGDTLHEWKSRIHPEDRDQCFADLEEHLSGRTPFYENEHRMKCKNGEYKWILDRGTVIQWSEDGKPLRVIGTHTDITDRKHIHDLLVEKEQHYRSLVNSLRDALIIVDANRKITDCNTAFTKLFGYTLTEVQGRTTDIIFASKDEYAQLGIMMQEKGEDSDFIYEPLYRKKTGEVFRGEKKVQYLRDENGKPVGFMGVIRDITDRKLTEEALKAKNNLLERIFKNNTDLIALTDLEGNFTMVSEAHKILGYDLDELIGTSVFDYVHPEDAASVGGEFTKFLQSPDQHRTVVYRNRRIDGEYLWFETTGIVLKDEAGNPNQILFNTRNITERTEIERNLRKQEAMYRNLLENSIDGVYLMNWTGKILQVNNTACEMLGYSREELLQLTIDDVDPNYPSQQFIKFWNDKPEGTTVLFETIHRRKDGKKILVEVNGIFFVLDDTKYLFGVSRDITERKRVEEDLRQMALILQNVDSVAVLKDPALRYLAANEAQLRLIGAQSMNEVIGKTDEELFAGNATEEQIAAFMENDRTALELPVGQVLTVEECIPAEDGSARTFSTKKFPIYDKENKTVLSVATLTTEITARKQAEEEIQRQLTEKETLLQEVHHRIKNNMTQIESLLSIQADSADSAEVKSALKEAMSRVRSTRTLYEKLLIGKGYEEVSMKDYLESLIDSLVDVFNNRPGVTVEKRIVDFPLNAKRAIPIGIMLNELLTNVFKYAFTGREDGHVSIELDKTKTRVTLTVTDDGVGLAKRVDANKSPGFGLTLVNMLAEQLEGTFSIESDNGTRSVVEFEV